MLSLESACYIAIKFVFSWDMGISIRLWYLRAYVCWVAELLSSPAVPEAEPADCLGTLISKLWLWSIWVKIIRIVIQDKRSHICINSRATLLHLNLKSRLWMFNLRKTSIIMFRCQTDNPFVISSYYILSIQYFPQGIQLWNHT